MLPANIQAIVDEFIPLLKQLAIGRYGIALGGSFGKGTFDEHSDLDLRLYGDDLLSDTDDSANTERQLKGLIEAEQKKGIRIDGYWPRKIGDINQALIEWQEGVGRPLDYIWTIWGYHLLPDIYHQHILDDPYGVLNGWKTQLQTYPPALKHTIFEKHLKFVRYWRDDYHYVNKTRRRDSVFLVGLSSKIVHSLIQLLFALNETYYVGDGNNLDFVKTFKHTPEKFADRIETILLSGKDGDGFMRQRELLVTLINEVEAVVETQEYNDRIKP